MVASYAPGCFVTGTDTGVGKTAVSAALTSALSQRGYRVAVMKPIETGSEETVASDAVRLQAAARLPLPLGLVCPYRLAPPLAPLTAAADSGITIDVSRIMAAFRQLRADHQTIIVEGVGGVLVPLTWDLTVADLMVAFGLPAVIVGRTTLGGINHALLTVEALRRRDVPIIGLVLNTLAPEPPGTRQLASMTEALSRLSSIPVLGPLPYEPALPSAWDDGIRTLAAHPIIQRLVDQLAPAAR